jgi:hypothetical protein
VAAAPLHQAQYQPVTKVYLARLAVVVVVD